MIVEQQTLTFRVVDEGSTDGFTFLWVLTPRHSACHLPAYLGYQTWGRVSPFDLVRHLKKYVSHMWWPSTMGEAVILKELQ